MNTLLATLLRPFVIPASVLFKTLLKRRKQMRNVLFLYQSYYHFYYLAQALNRRGWNAVLVNQDARDAANQRFYHGEDINIARGKLLSAKVKREVLFAWALKNFDLVHVAGDGCLSFFTTNFGWGESKALAADMQVWKRHGKKIAYTVSGCLSGVSQSSYARWSGIGRNYSSCDRCRWQHDPSVCCESRSLSWGNLIKQHCDLICAEGMPALDGLATPQTVFDPLTMCLDPAVWQVNLPIPPEHRIEKEPGEVLIYHGMANYELRTDESGRNIKGTPAIMAAVERLKAEGHAVRLLFCTGKRNIDVRYVQAQADIIVDQLNSGCYGAQAREGMMLGKPVICYIQQDNGLPGYPVSWKTESPLISATEESIYPTLKELLQNIEQLPHIGAKSRAYALKWHSADACAERYEKIIDAMMGNALHNS